MNPVVLPSLAQWRVRLGEIFLLSTPQRTDIAAVPAELVDVYECSAMNSRYVSYAAQFALPAGVWLAQSSYGVSASQATAKDQAQAAVGAWPLLLTPVLPGADGRARMEAVFHVPSQAVAAVPAPPAMDAREPSGSTVTQP